VVVTNSAVNNTNHFINEDSNVTSKFTLSHCTFRKSKTIGLITSAEPESKEYMTLLGVFNDFNAVYKRVSNKTEEGLVLKVFKTDKEINSYMN